MKRVLHLVHRDRHSAADLDDCRRLCRPGDGILLRGAAVTAVADRHAGLRDTGVRWYVLEGDLALHGLGAESLPEKVAAVDYRGFVELVCEYDTCQSW